MYKYGITVAKGYGGFSAGPCKSTYISSLTTSSILLMWLITRFFTRLDSPFERPSLAGDGLEAGSCFGVHLTGDMPLIFPFSH